MQIVGRFFGATRARTVVLVRGVLGVRMMGLVGVRIVMGRLWRGVIAVLSWLNPSADLGI